MCNRKTIGIDHWIKDTSFKKVDLITWEKHRIGMCFRTRRTCEYLLILQKPPVRAKDVWTRHNIPDVWSEKAVSNHPHTKPLEFQKALIEAKTNPEVIVLDPASVSWSVFQCCQVTNRNFIGSDVSSDFLG